MNYLQADRIRIFISSTITECQNERLRAEEAINSLNHVPIRFENAGARPYPPRSVYLRGIDESQIFIGVYKAEYGYIAEDMAISGIEDEYRFAKSRGVPMLLYAKRNCTRDSRLERLIVEMKGPFITVASYDNEIDLYDRLRDDITSLISDYFLGGLHLKDITPTLPRVIAEQLAPAKNRIQRKGVEEALLTELARNAIIVLRGPLGSGKTIVLATMADCHGWVFVECRNKTSKEVLVEATNGLRKALGLQLRAYAQLEEARREFRASWQALAKVTLVLDDVRSEDLFEAVDSVIDPIGDRHLIISARDTHMVSGGVNFDLPPLDRDEIREFVAKNREKPLLPGEIEELVEASKGNPLYLRYYASGEPRQFEHTLKDYELRTWRKLSPRSREALSYIALSPRILRLDQLLQLMSTEEGTVEEISASLNSAGVLICETERGYSIFHPHAKVTIREDVGSSPQKRLFYTKRLSRWFSERHDYTAVFIVLDNGGQRISDHLFGQAYLHAANQGDVRSAIRILERNIEAARSKENMEQVKHALIGLAQMLSIAGKADDALGKLQEAADIPASGDSLTSVDHVKLSILATVKGDASAITELQNLKKKYIDENRPWDAARAAADLSACFIRGCDYGRAADEAEFAMQIFREQGDTYGERIAKMNLMSAASLLPEKQELFQKLLAETQSSGENAPRQRAVVCNILGRLARENNDIEGSKAYAKEAIEIGRSLGEVSVVCSNLINLGNAYRQEGNLSAALEQYEAADKLARQSGYIHFEASAQRLMASIFNRRGDGRRALEHARYAIGLIKDGVFQRTELNAYEELAEAFELVRDTNSAREAWLHVADIEFKKEMGNEAGIEAFLRAVRLLHKKCDPPTYIETYRRIFAIEAKKEESGLSTFDVLTEDICKLLKYFPVHHVFELSVYHGCLVFNGLPKIIARQVYLRIMNKLFENGVDSNDVIKRTRAALAISMAVPSGTLSTADLVEIGEYLSTRLPSVSFRAHTDGASHWALELNVGRSAVITLSQLDDRNDVSLVSLCLVLMLLSYAEEVSDQVLAGALTTRNEASILVINYDEAKRELPLENIGLQTMDDSCAVTRSADPKRDPGCPIVVITRSDLTRDWLVGKGRVNAGQILFAKVLVELVFHLVAGEIELDLLNPKVVTLVKKTVI